MHTLINVNRGKFSKFKRLSSLSEYCTQANPEFSWTSKKFKKTEKLFCPQNEIKKETKKKNQLNPLNRISLIFFSIILLWRLIASGGKIYERSIKVCLDIGEPCGFYRSQWKDNIESLVREKSGITTNRATSFSM